MSSPEQTSNDDPMSLERQMEQLKGTSAERIQAIWTLQSLNVQKKMLRKLDELVPHGASGKLSLTINATGIQLDSLNTMPYPLPWKSVQLFNDGPAVVYFGLNQNYVDPVAWNPNEALTYDLGTDQIRTIIFQTASGSTNTSKIRIFILK